MAKKITTSTVFLTSYGLSMLGNSIAAVVLPLVVLLTTGSALDAGLVAAATVLPAVLAGVFMGGVVDRVHRRSVSIAADLISAAAIAALPLVDQICGLSLGWFVLFGIIGSFGDVPGLTAREALLPDVARHEGRNVGRLVALRESTGALVMLVGPAMAAGLVVIVGGSGALWVTAGTSCLAASVTLLLPREVGKISGEQRGGSPREALAHLREGWSLLFRRSPFLLSTTILNLALVTVLTAIQGLLLPVYFTEQGQEARLGLVLSALAAGLLVGSALYAAVGASISRRTWLVTGLLVSVAGITTICLLPPLWWILGGAVVLGLTGGVVSTVIGVLMTERIPDQLRGRVTGTQNAIVTAAPSLGVLGAALAVEHASLGTAGILILAVWVVTVVAAVLVPSLRDLEPQELETVVK
ncbi:MFS transporter [Nakamurella sp. A5-74]|uniref:Multidrug efflux pump Tap n=1 Tax=Nakamurella sp. A5-74 TaxID=3158264 RepID=A0AAU8DWL1_9ACTN